MELGGVGPGGVGLVGMGWGGVSVLYEECPARWVMLRAYALDTSMFSTQSICACLAYEVFCASGCYSCAKWRSRLTPNDARSKYCIFGGGRFAWVLLTGVRRTCSTSTLKITTRFHGPRHAPRTGRFRRFPKSCGTSRVGSGQGVGVRNIMGRVSRFSNLPGRVGSG